MVKWLTCGKIIEWKVAMKVAVEYNMIESAIADYFKTQPVLRAWLFGSYSRGEETRWSDIDILVQYDRTQPIGLLKIAGMKIDLEDILNREVDLVEDGTLHPWAVESVNRDKKLIYERT